jgi:hypothetical protein
MGEKNGKKSMRQKVKEMKQTTPSPKMPDIDNIWEGLTWLVAFRLKEVLIFIGTILLLLLIIVLILNYQGVNVFALFGGNK